MLRTTPIAEPPLKRSPSDSTQAAPAATPRITARVCVFLSFWLAMVGLRGERILCFDGDGGPLVLAVQPESPQTAGRQGRARRPEATTRAGHEAPARSFLAERAAYPPRERRRVGKAGPPPRSEERRVGKE